MNLYHIKRISNLLVLLFSCLLLLSCNRRDNKKEKKIGNTIDSLNGVYVFYNGNVSNTNDRNITQDGYNLGLKYQCVEFVKRYYYQYLNHKMPDSYGHAKDFFDKNVKDGKKNKKRNLFQYTNPSKKSPIKNDLLIFSGNIFNKYGHVAIVSDVTEIEITYHNQGPLSTSRETFKLVRNGNKCRIDNNRILAWLRKE